MIYDFNTVRNDGIRNRGTSNGAVPGLNRENNVEDESDKTKSFSVEDLVFHIETICSGQTDFGYINN
jgi:hypothetical protein